MHETWPEDPQRRTERGYSYEQPTQGSQTPPPPPPYAAQDEPAPKRFGWPVLLIAVLLAALLGGGIGGLAVSYFGSDSAAVSEGNQQTPQLNRTDEVTPTTEAAAVAAPSVVTLSVGDDSAQGSGSGVILDEEGHILTNTHVVTLGGQTAAANVLVQTNDGEVYEAEVVGLDPLSDLAVIKIEAGGLTPIEMGSAEDLNVGDQAIAIGAPLGLAGTVTEGIISTLDRTISVASSAVPEEPDAPEQENPFEFRLPDQPEPSAPQGQIHLNVIQSDAAINPGNSGGALVDEAGRLIGINVAIATRSEGNVGLGFAIPVDYAQRVAEEIIENGEASHGMLGVMIVPAGDQYVSSGARIEEIIEDGPADGTELRKGDVIVGIDGKSVDSPGSLSATVREYPAGTEVELTVERDGEELTETVTLGGAN